MVIEAHLERECMLHCQCWQDLAVRKYMLEHEIGPQHDSRGQFIDECASYVLCQQLLSIQDRLGADQDLGHRTLLKCCIR